MRLISSGTVGHLGHRKHYLLQDGVPHGFRGHFQETITQIVIDRSLGQQHFRRCQFNQVAIDLKTAAGHLENAAKEPFAYIDASPQEWEMRELNRRADITP